MQDTEKNELSSEKNSAEKLIAFVARYYGVHLVDMFRKVRKKGFVIPRQVAMYILREHLKLSFPLIGGYFGSRDHSTVIHSYQKIKKQIQNDSEFKTEIERLETAIREDKLPLEAVIPDAKETKKIKEAQSSDYMTIGENRFSFNGVPSENQERNSKILMEYRSGLSLEEVACKFKITRERIRQIVKKEIVREAYRNGSAGMTIDVKELFKEEKSVHSMAMSGRRNPRPMILKKEKRWSRYYSQCRGCETTSIKHKRKGYCQVCLGNVEGKLREDILRGKDQKCEKCGIERSSAISKFGRDLYIMTGAKKVLCRKCFLQLTGRKLYEHRISRVRQELV